MKKFVLSLVVLLAAEQTFACLGEAQIIARVNGQALTGSTSCKVTIDPHSIKFYKRNQTCPLDIHALFQNGVEVGVRREDICSLDVNDTISGVLVQDATGTIHLER